MTQREGWARVFVCCRSSGIFQNTPGALVSSREWTEDNRSLSFFLSMSVFVSMSFFFFFFEALWHEVEIDWLIDWFMHLCFYLCFYLRIYLCIDVFVCVSLTLMEKRVIENYIIILKTCSTLITQSRTILNTHMHTTHTHALQFWQVHDKACGAIWHIFYQDY